MFEVFGLKLRFKIDKLESALYGYEGWEILWDCFDMEVFRKIAHYPTLDFFSGDEGHETFCVCIEALAMKPEHELFFNDLAKRISIESRFNILSQTKGIERYNNSVIANSYSPFEKILSIKDGKIINSDSFGSTPAMEALKPHIQNSKAELQKKPEKKGDIEKPVEDVDLNKLVRQMLFDRKTVEEILVELEFYKASESEAKEILRNVCLGIGKGTKKEGNKNIIRGSFWTVGGIFATLLSIGGLISYVFMVVTVLGFIQLIQGIVQRIRGRRLMAVHLHLDINFKKKKL